MIVYVYELRSSSRVNSCKSIKRWSTLSTAMHCIQQSDRATASNFRLSIWTRCRLCVMRFERKAVTSFRTSDLAVACFQFHGAYWIWLSRSQCSRQLWNIFESCIDHCWKVDISYFAWSFWCFVDILKFSAFFDNARFSGTSRRD